MKIEAFFVTIFSVFILSYTSAQNNLVFNPSFEELDTCPNSLGQVDFALGWTSYKQSPDYYNSCSGPASFISVPSNVAGFQNAHSGLAYMGVQTFFTPGTREIIGSGLLNPMVVGRQYYISLYICCAFDTLQQGIQVACASNKIGVKFSTSSFSISNPVPINNFANLYIDSILKDTIDWFHLTGSFVADSSYNFIMIGNFFDDLNTDTIQFFQNYFRSYYLIDDICVSDYPECLLTSQIDEKFHSNALIYNQKEENLIIDPDGKGSSILKIYNIYGKLVYEKLITDNYIAEFSMSEYNNGIYIACLSTKTSLYNLKFIVY